MDDTDPLLLLVLCLAMVLVSLYDRYNADDRAVDDAAVGLLANGGNAAYDTRCFIVCLIHPVAASGR